MNLEMFTKKFSDKLPDVSGVYFFLDGKGEILYIGKATSLRDRVRSYFTQDLLLTRGPKIVRMLELAESIEWQTTDSSLEALLLEANLIHTHRPPYNTDAKDDKSWNFVVITEEKFPRVLVERGRKIKNYELRMTNDELGGGEKNKQPLPRQSLSQRTLTVPPECTRVRVRVPSETLTGNKNRHSSFDIQYSSSVRAMFGPFPSGGALKEAVKIVRRIFPFRDTCTPFEERNPKRDIGPARNTSRRDVAGPARNISRRRRDMGGCFNAQIGLCPSVCVGAVSAREYGKTIRNIALFFEGKKTTIIRNLEREMKREAKALHFERANEIKKTLFALGHIQDVALLKRDMFESPSLGSFGGPKSPSLEGSVGPRGVPKIEAYDVAHLGGRDTVGVMTVVSNGEIRKNEYRKFIIRGETKGNDLAALEELLQRRLKHGEWALPSLVVVDGGALQRSVAEAVLRDFALDIPVVSVVKDARHQPKGILGPKKERDAFKDDILLANSEAHRYAISFHRKRRGKAFLT